MTTAVTCTRRRQVTSKCQVKRLTKSSEVWATSCQPWSIVREWPRFGSLTIFVSAGLCFCPWVEVRVAHLGERDPGAGDVVGVVELLRFLLVERVRPAVLELVEGEG